MYDQLSEEKTRLREIDFSVVSLYRFWRHPEEIRKMSSNSNEQISGTSNDSPLFRNCTLLCLLIGLGFFLLNIFCLAIVYVKLNRRIGAHKCQSSVKETIPSHSSNTCELVRVETPIMTIVTNEGDSDTSSETSESTAQSSSPIQKNPVAKDITYTTIQFNAKRLSADYENLCGASDYVNVTSKVKKEASRRPIKGETVDYTDIIPNAISKTNNCFSP
ncbi:hypothetical protein XELAEV_18014969mg [Xenopus laevis]|nr:hypothetical protein XELAEV_18014969mg [Xenopus laevis]